MKDYSKFIKRISLYTLRFPLYLLFIVFISIACALSYFFEEISALFIKIFKRQKKKNKYQLLLSKQLTDNGENENEKPI